MNTPLKTYWQKFRNSKDGRTVASNMAYLTVLQAVSYLFPLLTMPYLARVLGADGLGKIAFAAAVIMWLQTVTDWGFNYTATREVAKERDNWDKVSLVFSTVLWARCLLALFSLLVLTVLIAAVPRFRENWLILLFTFIQVPTNILFPSWFFQALERMKYLTIFGVAIRFVFTVSVFVFIRTKADYLLQPLLVSLGYLTSGLLAMYIILRNWKVRLMAVPFSNIMQTVKGSTNVFINNLMPNLYNSFSVILLGMFCPPANTGLYDAGKKLTTLSNTLMSVFSRTFFPYLSRKIEKHNLYRNFSLTIAALVTLFLLVAAPWLIMLFFGKEFADSVLILRITSVAVFFIALNEVYGTNYLIVKNHDSTMRNITLASSLFGFCIAFPLVYYFQHLGAAIVYAVTSTLLGVLSYIFAIKYMKKDNCILV